jgi:hypothetical protein
MIEDSIGVTLVVKPIEVHVLILGPAVAERLVSATVQVLQDFIAASEIPLCSVCTRPGGLVKAQDMQNNYRHASG